MKYGAFGAEDLKFLRDLCGDERVTPRDAIGDDFCHDELGGAFARPDVRVQALTVEEISRIMRHAFERSIPVTVRGSGTGLVGGAVPVEGGILLDTSAMTRILELDEENMTLEVEPGALGEPLYLDVVAALAQQGVKAKVVGGRYGLGSKDTTPASIFAGYLQTSSAMLALMVLPSALE